jgi:membrane protease YdiL (CAAX protease family)
MRPPSRWKIYSLDTFTGSHPLSGTLGCGRMLSEKPWQPDLVLRLMLGIFASISLGTIIVQGLTPKGADSPGATLDLATFMVGTLTFHGVALVLVNVFLRQHSISWSEAFGFRATGLARALLFAWIVTLVVLPIALSLGQLSAKLLTFFHQPVKLQQAVESLQSAVSLTQRLYFGIAAIVVAPFVEEVIFRGILYPAIKQRGFPRLALWGTSLFFAITHANLMTLLPLTFLALILTLLYETTNNLLAPIATHSFFNAANFFWLLYQMKHQIGG